MAHLGHLYAAYGFCSQGFDIYLATGLHEGSVQRETTEQDMRHQRVERDDFLRMVREGLVVDGASLAATAFCACRTRAFRGGSSTVTWTP
jgi:hypothetical protein